MSLSRLLRSRKLKHKKTPSVSTTELVADKETVELSEQHRKSEDGTATKEMKTTWPIFMEVLRTVKEASDAIPPLMIALTGLLELLEQYEIAGDIQDGFYLLYEKLEALHLIVKCHQCPPVPKTVEERLKGLGDWVKSVTTSIEAQISRSPAYWFFDIPENRKLVAELLGLLTWAIDLFALDTSLENEEKLSKIDQEPDDLEISGLLSELKPVDAANFKSQRGELCLQGTRCSVIADIMSWCINTSGPRVYWLSGMAGTGKSAIARTICDNLLKASACGLLGGSFFCSRWASADEQDTRQIVPTLAWQLSHLNKSYKKKLVERLERDLGIIGATVERQLQELIIKPYQDQEIRIPMPLIIVIDALDEGARADDTAQLLKAIIEQADKAEVPLKFFVTSRPESYIRSQFIDPSHASEHTTFFLQSIQECLVQADIRLYVTYRLERIKKDPKYRLPAQWPSKEEAERLVDRAAKLFIFAFTACNYIEGNPYDGLNKVIEASGRDDRPLAEKMDVMYALILDEATDSSSVPLDVIRTIRRCLVVLIYAREILTLSALARFIGIDTRRIQSAVDQLHSLILMPSSDDGEMTTLHVSFGDYLVDESRSGKHFISKDEAHFTLLQCCFETLDADLRFNVAQACTSFLSNKDQRLALPQHLLYAATRWADYVPQNSLPEQSKVIVSWIEKTLVPKFLFWLEAMSVAELTEAIPDMLQTLLSFVKTTPDLIRFIDDGIDFAYESKGAISRSVPHIYLSALAFGRDRSMIKEKFWPQYKGIAKIKYEGTNRLKAWELCLRRHIHSVVCVAFSPDGSRIISGSFENTVRVWDAHTGQPAMPPLKEHTSSVRSVAYSPDGNRIVSGSGDFINSDKTVRVWDAHTGQPAMPPLKGHTNPVSSVAYSPDGNRIVSGSIDNTVRVWDAHTGQPAVPPLKGHTSYVYSVAYSPDGNRIVSGSDDNTVRVLDVFTGHPSTPLSINPLSYTDSSPSSVALPYSLPQQPHHFVPFQLSKVPLFDPSPTVSDLRDLFSFDIDDGWIKGPNGELFIWIPRDMRYSLYTPRTSLIINQTRLHLDLSNFLYGEDWESCNQVLPVDELERSQELEQIKP